MRELLTEIEIAASPECVWNVLVDFNKFHEWNPLIKEIEGELKEGNRLKVRVKQPGISITFRPEIKRVVLNHEFRWVGHLVVPGLMNGEHSFKIINTTNGKVRFVQHETYRGLLAPLFWTFWRAPTKQGFMAMDQALKQRVEQLAGDQACS